MKNHFDVECCCNFVVYVRVCIVVLNIFIATICLFLILVFRSDNRKFSLKFNKSIFMFWIYADNCLTVNNPVIVEKDAFDKQ